MRPKRSLLTLATLPLLLLVALSTAFPVKEDYYITFAVFNHNVTGPVIDDKPTNVIFRLEGIDHTADFVVPPGETYSQRFDAAYRGFWTLYVQFEGGRRYAKGPSKEISRDSFGSWIIDVFGYSDRDGIGFSHWRKWRPALEQKRRHAFVLDY